MSRRSSNEIPIIRLIPNIITFFSVCVGLTALRMGLQGNLSLALYLLILAMVLDALDGKIARAMQSESKIGAELDSLADFFNFGIATPLIVFFTVFLNSAVTTLGWLAVMTVAVCCAFRLARFNVVVAEAGPNDKVNPDFSGVPAPMLACLSMSPLFLVMLGIEVTEDFAVPAAVYLMFCGLLAIGNFPTYSIKSISVPEKFQFLLMLIVALLLVFVVVYPWHTLLACNAVYLISLPVYARASLRRQRDSDS